MVSVDAPEPEARAAAACSRLLEALPTRVAEQQRRQVDPEDAYAAAWGDPPIVLRCGVGRPAGFDRLSVCQVANGVGWFIPEQQITNEPTEIVMTTVDRHPRVEVRLPEEYHPPAAAMVHLAPALKQTTEQTEPC